MSDSPQPARSFDAGPRCPFCASVSVELLSLFGSQLLTEQYYCRACGTPFEHIKDAHAETDAMVWRRGGDAPGDGSLGVHGRDDEASRPSCGTSSDG